MEQLIFGTVYLAKGIVYGMIIYMIFFCATKAANCRKEKPSEVRYITEAIFTIYIVILLQITGTFNIFSWKFTANGTFNWVPFINEDIRLILLNVLLFVPMGILIPLIFKLGRGWINISAVGAGSSILIELIQMFFAGRTADIDDILANTAGCVMGYVIFLCGKKLWQQGSKKQIGIGTFTGIAAIAVLLLSLPFNRICLGDVLLMQGNFPAWSGNTGEIYSMEGIHYTLVYGVLIELILFLVTRKKKCDFGAKAGLFICAGACALILTVMVIEQIWK